MNKLCCIFNIPSLYREAIYLAIDKAYDCEWYFVKEKNDIALFDEKKLKFAETLPYGKFIRRFYTMKGLIVRLWKRNDFDAYLMIGTPMCISIWGLCILIRIFFPKKKIYFWTHGWYGKETKLESLIKKQFLKLAHGLFVYGSHAKELLVKEGFNKDKIFVIHNSLNYDKQLKLRDRVKRNSIYEKYFGNDNKVLVMIGRLTPRKHLDVLIQAVHLLKNSYNQLFNVVIIGDGQDRRKLEELVLELNLDKQVWFYGACYDELKNAELIYNSDLCVVPGDIGLTAIHTLMFGVPIITHDNFKFQGPEFEAIIPGKTGAYYKYFDTNDLAKQILNWFKTHFNDREAVRNDCFDLIDSEWNPIFQMKVLKNVFDNI